MSLAIVFENLEAGSSIEEIIEQFHLTREQIQLRSNSPPAVLTRSPFPLVLLRRMHLLGFSAFTVVLIALFIKGTVHVSLSLFKLLQFDLTANKETTAALALSTDHNRMITSFIIR